ncbi:MAG TPA: hypothetical protein VME20_04455 [Acidimicrobiales bacterium]|nr:hypothetical protein [Acidimicrobiales bacterium]
MPVRHVAGGSRLVPVVAGPNQGSLGPDLDNSRSAELEAMDLGADGA